jgi:hypothetical protein
VLTPSQCNHHATVTMLHHKMWPLKFGNGRHLRRQKV